MNNFFEHVSVDAEAINERKTEKGSELYIQLKFQQADHINNNKRLYRKELLNREIEKINEKIRKGDYIWAHSFHPSDGIGKPQYIKGLLYSISVISAFI